jgi:hypothetical protein
MADLQEIATSFFLTAEFTDWIQAFSAAAVSVFTYFLWRLSSRQTDLLSDSVHAARISAEAALKSADMAERALIGVQRPILKVTCSPLQISPPAKHIDFEEYRTDVTITNIGKEPAIVVASAIQFVPRLQDAPLPQPGVRPFDPVWSSTDLDDETLVAPGDSVSFAVTRFMDPEKGEHIQNFQGLKGCLFIYGIVVYDDLMGFRREHGFSYGWAVPDQAFFRCSFEGFNYDRLVPQGTVSIEFAPLVYSAQSTPDPH